MHQKFSQYTKEAGTDEAGRGCLAGPVTAAAVILPDGFRNNDLNDSKKLSEKQRNYLRKIIKDSALYYAVAHVFPKEIDTINILKASIKAMHVAMSKLGCKPNFIAVDGNRFLPYENIPHSCIVKGDAKYLHIAAASVLAKTHRDEYMLELHQKFPKYDWAQNKGYPTAKHRQAIQRYGITKHHRKSFRLLKPIEV